MKTIKLSDEKLTALFNEVSTELRRRTAKAVSHLDDATIIRGNEMCKRALTVAAAGHHSILFLGPPASGKTMLRTLSLHFDVISFESCRCPCGYHQDTRRECICTNAKIKSHRAKWPRADIAVETYLISERDMNGKSVGTSLEEMKSALTDLPSFTSCELGEECRNLLRSAVSELAIDADSRQRILLVARSIANLDRSESIRPSHICEAINYQTVYRI